MADDIAKKELLECLKAMQDSLELKIDGSQEQIGHQIDGVQSYLELKIDGVQSGLQ